MDELVFEDAKPIKKSYPLTWFVQEVSQLLGFLNRSG
ncbi:hypothetical protein DFO77_106132 [Marinilabilia salmonicolor]|jgi:hypothetical protein|uniref:Uncharacterized protein n=1 Tax=Marinilabilia salmonicolor TaxID=989 RepID=A0A2T0XLF8_9BACT|nr:hypothetical protein BY457_10833 [Marinilabilia salmonicolor]RCW37438.1 hypothetical protein DFO77_106132 [Marinilabilia salmonicolor]